MHLTPSVIEDRLLRIRDRAKAGSRKSVPAKVQAYLRGEPARPTTGEAPGESTTERRRSCRVSVRSEIVIRRIGGFNFQVAMTDVSSGGCRVEMIEPCEIGDSVITRLPELEPLGSRVCWREGAVTGMEFLTPFHPAVFDALVARLPGLSPA